MLKNYIVTIDGPSGAGKSTISRALADHLHFTYLDTGAMYRAVGLKIQRANLDLDDPADRVRLAEVLDDLDLRFQPAGRSERLLLAGEDVSDLIRTAEMGLIASRVSAEKPVRDKLTALQRQLGRKGSVVAEGRDMGTVVFPGADYKFYLDAAAEERARRRQAQLHAQGQAVDLQAILQQIITRDENDRGRDLAPLKPAAAAIIIDSTAMTIEQVVEFMVQYIKRRPPAAGRPST